ncbi:MAG: amidohydrolase family protein [Blastocatellia bacterium]|nr:amidohydrolase family protein [Blastocatellia bacterium]MBO0800084.1 amidohydrolase family protein [Blastocatellia bacterium]
MIVDAHVHIGKSTRLQIDVDGEQLVRVADDMGFDRICCTDLTALFYDMEEGNRLLYAEMKKFPDRIIGYASLHSTRFGEKALDELDRCAHDYGMRGLKIYSTPQMSIAEPAAITILEKTVDLKLPILAHATPLECEYLMAAVPECKLIMAHAAAQPFANGDWNRAIMAAQRHPNLYLETASSTIDAGFLETCVRELGPERIIFGTDIPLLDPYFQLSKIRDTVVDSCALEKILGGNILRLMGLSQW